MAKKGRPTKLEELKKKEQEAQHKLLHASQTDPNFGYLKSQLSNPDLTKQEKEVIKSTLKKLKDQHDEQYRKFDEEHKKAYHDLSDYEEKSTKKKQPVGRPKIQRDSYQMESELDRDRKNLNPIATRVRVHRIKRKMIQEKEEDLRKKKKGRLSQKEKKEIKERVDWHFRFQKGPSRTQKEQDARSDRRRKRRSKSEN